MQFGWRLEILGGPRLLGAGLEVEGLERKTAALLAYLALEGPTPRVRLAGLLWPHTSDKQARGNLRQLLFKLKCYPGLVTAGDPLKLQADVAVDAAALFGSGANGKRVELAGSCLEGSRELLAGLDFDDCVDLSEWLLLQRERIQELLCRSLESEAERLEGAGSHREALALTRRLVDLDPISEVGYRRLMRLYSLTGDRAAALQAYRLCRDRLHRTLGVEPLPETTELANAIEEGNRPPRRPTVPLSPTPLLGRSEELERLAASLASPDRRLLTIIGAGGIGKTRLAMEAVSKCGTAFADGACFVSLTPLNGERQLVAAIADALGFSFYEPHDPDRQLLGHLREKELLLVLDDFEHLRESVDLVSELLTAAPRVKLLVTSRERLHIDGEGLVALEGLRVPDPAADDPAHASSYRLFMQRAQRLAPQARFTQADTAHIAAICRAVDGMPLAIELAAAWTWALSPREILAGIEESLGFLSAPRGELPEKHRSVRAAFDHSWNLLTPPEQDLFGRLSVFRGGFDKEAAFVVARAPLSILLVFMSRSLLKRTSAGRFEMHELLRQYAGEKLAAARELEATRDRHCSYFTAFLRKREGALDGGRQEEALGEVADELHNILFSWEWAVNRSRLEELGLGLHGLFRFWVIRSRFQEGLERFEKAVQGSPNESLLTARLLARQADLYRRLARCEEAKALLRRSLALLERFESWEEMAFALQVLGTVHHLLGEYEAARDLYLRSLSLRRKGSDDRAEGQLLNNLGLVAYELGRYGEAREYYLEALANFRRHADGYGVALCANNLGLISHELGEYQQARGYYAESLEISKASENADLRVSAMNNLGLLAYEQERYAEARDLHRESLTLAEEIEERRSQVVALNNLGFIALAEGDFASAKRLQQRSLELARRIEYERGVVYSLIGLGEAEDELGEAEAAQGRYRRALEAALRLGALSQVTRILLVLAARAAKLGEHDRALELLAPVLEHPASDIRTKKGAGELLEELKKALPPFRVDAAIDKGKEGDLVELAMGQLDVRADPNGIERDSDTGPGPLGSR